MTQQTGPSASPAGEAVRVLVVDDSALMRKLISEMLERAPGLSVAGVARDGEEGLRRRHRTASRYLDDFGVAMYCGFGRQPGQDPAETLREHAAVVRALRH